MRQHTKRHATARLALLAVVAVLGVAGLASAGSSGRCVTAVIPSAFTLPDGSVHAAGPLRICHDRDYSPVAGLHTTWVDGKPVGTFLSYLGESEGPGGEPYVQFADLHSGVWLLQGYAVAERGHYRTYRIESFGPRRGKALDLDRMAQGIRPDDVVLVAAR